MTKVATKKEKRELKNCPKLSERDQRLIIGYLSAYLIDVEKAVESVRVLHEAAPDLLMMRNQLAHWRSVKAGVKELLRRSSCRQWWLTGWTEEELERMQPCDPLP